MCPFIIPGIGSRYSASEKARDRDVDRGGRAGGCMVHVFCYGLGGFEYLFKIDYPNLSSKYADHAHSDLPEFIGELGLIGFLNLLFVFLMILIKNNFFYFKNLLLIYYLITLLIFDFSLHIPIVQFLLVILFSINIDNNKFKSVV